MLTCLHQHSAPVSSPRERAVLHRSESTASSEDLHDLHHVECGFAAVQLVAIAASALQLTQHAFARAHRCRMPLVARHSSKHHSSTSPCCGTRRLRRKCSGAIGATRLMVETLHRPLPPSTSSTSWCDLRVCGRFLPQLHSVLHTTPVYLWARCHLRQRS